MRHRFYPLVFVWITACLLLSACGQKAIPNTGKIQPATVEDIEGSDFKRVTLTEKAAERIDVQTALVLEEDVARKRTVGGQIVTAASVAGKNESGAEPSANIASASGVEGQIWVRVPLNESDLKKVDRGHSATVRTIPDDDDGDEDEEGLVVDLDEAQEMDAAEDIAEDRALYYMLNSADHGLAEGQRVFVELYLAGNATRQLIIPYAAVLYGLEGETWVYTNPEPLVFVRQPILIDYITGDQAVLKEGPPAGTEVVIVGAAELYGAETGVSK